MDNHNNSYDFIEDIETSELMGQDYTGGPVQNRDPKKNKDHFGIGIFLGVIITFLVSGAVIFGYSKVTGKYLVLGRNGVASENDNTLLDSETVDKVQEVSNYIDLYYYDDFDKEKLKSSLVSGVAKGLEDPYSIYYTKQEYEDLQINTTGSYYGIGCGLAQAEDTKIVTVTKVYAGTPAEESGLKKDDVILTVNGIDSTKEELTDLVQEIRGEEGTTVKLEVYRDSTKETFTLDVERRNVELPSVEGKIINDNIAYIQILEFQSGTAEQFKSIFEDLKKQGATSLIVDLRDNPGGLLTSVVDILDYLLPEGTVVYTEDKFGQKDVYSSDASCIDINMTVLINGNSASASEIFAGAIKDYKYGEIIGTTSFGKGIVQTIFPLSDGDALKITTAKYFTPEGNFIHGVGISPDIEIEYEYTGDKEADYDVQYDNQVQKAIEVLGE